VNVCAYMYWCYFFVFFYAIAQSPTCIFYSNVLRINIYHRSTYTVGFQVRVVILEAATTNISQFMEVMFKRVKICARLEEDTMFFDLTLALR
jgi:hypothetical protein